MTSSNDKKLSKKMNKGDNVKEKTIEELYVKKNEREHILLRTGMYIGSTDIEKIKLFVYDKDGKMMYDQKDINQGLYKIFDEILVNASDRVIESNCDTIKVTINRETGYISVWNNGDTIPIAKHAEYNIWVPELIFGHFRTGSNFNDDEDRLCGGMNGYGAKLTAVFSDEFNLEIVNVEYKKKYEQKFKNNLEVIEEPLITKTKEKASYTKISFLPSYNKFKCVGLSEDMERLFIKRVYDMAGTSMKKIKVYLNEELIHINGFEEYISCFYQENDNKKIIYKTINERWSVGVVIGLNNGFKQISYVNRICTFYGGNHVDYLVNIIVDNITKKIVKKNKTLEIKPLMIKDKLNIFINCSIIRPDFDTQSKTKLITKSSEWDASGYPCTIDEKFMKDIYDTNIIDLLIEEALFNQDKKLNKALSSKKTNTIRDIEKLYDAEYAGTQQSHKCTLILTEGDSALSLVIPALRTIGNAYYGAAPLKGKIINVRKAKEALIKNEEIKNIVKMLGLKYGEVYTDTKKLRYGNVMIFTDQDYDGFHIKGLFLNFIHMYWPSLIKIGYVTKLDTPILKLIGGKKSLSFYSIPEYNEWKKQNADKHKSYRLKYYKGLGTSTSLEAKEYFEDYSNKVSKYNSVNDDKTNNIMELAFGKNKEDERKDWVNSYNENDFIHTTVRSIDIVDFCDMELKQFSFNDNIRSIPNMYDGLKPSQRKILYVALHKLRGKEEKVSAFSGDVSTITDYHHGEASLQGAIVNMAQNYCGSNNINLLQPIGQFGSRLLGGKDSASPRYIFTSLTPLSEYIFISDDNPILDYEYSDDKKIEPKEYYPVIPMLLVNGSEGIGTGYSTDVPPYNPLDICDCIYKYLNNEPMHDIQPWYNKYNGIIRRCVDKKNKVFYEVEGLIETVDEQTLNITEIPITKKGNDYQDFLNSITVMPGANKKDDNNDSKILEYNKININIGSNDDDINFTVVFKHGIMQKELKAGTLLKTLKLTSTISISNIHCYVNGKIRKYNNVCDLITDFCIKKLEIYEKRINYIIKKLENGIEVLFYKIKYINDILDKHIIIERQKKINIINRLGELKYPELSEKIEDEPSYDYLFSFTLMALTEEKISELSEKYNNAKQELDYYKKITPKELWIKELDTFKEQYAIFQNNNHNNDKNNKLSKKKSKKSKA